ncbi:nuclear transport factor 2 family protein [Streptococcus pacificus]|uniref:Nuclear transport factor 2 family protein n=1 Tax=Streptococcus pacificus TaxID=2740577 RepID=A0ABS0ZJY1_9STRE|nr:nuclear transport factor 2 family protein [Streptococcus pacificus]MBJ8326249.1 nuclear transport factor 2 family protein [Streptococcus pacificus]
MNIQDILALFFKAENERDWESYQQFLSPDVVWELHSNDITKIEGKEKYLDTIKSAYEGNTNSFVVESFFMGQDPSKIVAILRNNLGERSCDIFEFKEGLIVREYEFIL